MFCSTVYAAEKTICLFVKIRPFSTSADLEQVSMNLVVKRFFNCSLFRMLRSIREPPAESFSLGPHRRRFLDRCHCHRNSCSGCRRNSEMRPNKRFLKAMKDFCFIIFRTNTYVHTVLYVSNLRFFNVSIQWQDYLPYLFSQKNF